MTGEYTTISRDTWTEAMNGLATPDPAVRSRAYTRLLAAAPPGWDTGLDDVDVEPEFRPRIPPRGEGTPGEQDE